MSSVVMLPATASYVAHTILCFAHAARCQDVMLRMSACCRQAFHVRPAQLVEWTAYFQLDDALAGSQNSLERACQSLPGAPLDHVMKPPNPILLLWEKISSIPPHGQCLLQRLQGAAASCWCGPWQSRTAVCRSDSHQSSPRSFMSQMRPCYKKVR